MPRQPCAFAWLAFKPTGTAQNEKGPTWGLFVEKWTLVLQRLLGKLNTAPSRTPAEGQRCVMVLRLV